MIDLSSLKFGTDAEIFLRTMDGHPIPVTGMVGGTKDKPIPLPELGEGFAMQEDNAALEINTPATSSISKFGHNYTNTLSYIKSRLPKSVVYDYAHSSLIFNEEFLKIPGLTTFGCDPDYNAFTMKANARPSPKIPGHRSAAAHVHLGWNDPSDENRLELIRLADVFVVLPNLEYESKDETLRRTLYGKAGSFRWKKYGVEHRVLSNKWIIKNATLTLRRYVDAVVALNKGIVIEPEDYARIMESINKPHLLLAAQIYKKYHGKLIDAVGGSIYLPKFYAQFK
jgi:hypothetical protein